MGAPCSFTKTEFSDDTCFLPSPWAPFFFKDRSSERRAAAARLQSPLAKALPARAEMRSHPLALSNCFGCLCDGKDFACCKCSLMGRTTAPHHLQIWLDRIAFEPIRQKIGNFERIEIIDRELDCLPVALRQCRFNVGVSRSCHQPMLGGQAVLLKQKRQKVINSRSA